MSKFDNIKEGHIVRVKFKEIKEFTKTNNMSKSLHAISEWCIGENVTCIVLGGDYIVTDVASGTEKGEWISIHNHHDGDDFTVPEFLVDSIEIVDSSNHFVSEDHGMIMVQIEDKLYVNGVELVDSEDDEKHKPMTKFTEFMEKFVLDRALTNTFGEESEKDS